MTDLCKTITDYPTVNGAMPLLYTIRDCIPFAYEAILVGIFFLLFAGNYFIIKNKTGRAKIFVALIASAVATTILSVLLALAQLVVYKVCIFWAFMVIIFYIFLELSDKS